MVRITLATITFTATLLAVPVHTMAQDASLQQCQKWHSQIERYTDLRRAGGKAQQMEGWKRQRKVYEDKFKDARCRRHGKQVRK